LFIKNPKREDDIVVTAGTMDESSLSKWRPDKEYYCKRKGVWLGNIGAEEKQFEQVD
jgi:hypothetical protein